MRLVRHFDESTGQICVAVNELERASMDLRFEGRRVARSKLISVATGSWSRECGAPLWLRVIAPLLGLPVQPADGAAPLRAQLAARLLSRTQITMSTLAAADAGSVAPRPPSRTKCSTAPDWHRSRRCRTRHANSRRAARNVQQQPHIPDEVRGFGLKTWWGDFAAMPARPEVERRCKELRQHAHGAVSLSGLTGVSAALAGSGGARCGCR